MQLYGGGGVGVAQMDADFPDLPLDGQTDRLRGMRGLSSVSRTERGEELIRKPLLCTELRYKVGPRLRELAPSGQREPGGMIHVT